MTSELAAHAALHKAGVVAPAPQLLCEEIEVALQVLLVTVRADQAGHLALDQALERSLWVAAVLRDVQVPVQRLPVGLVKQLASGDLE